MVLQWLYNMKKKKAEDSVTKKPKTTKPKKPRKRKTTNVHYVDNKELYEHLKYYLERYNDAFDKQKAQGLSKDEMDLPPVTDYIADAIFKICDNLSRKSNFFGYTYREDMVLDGAENCLRYISNFKPDKSKNPFSYFSQIAYYAFLRRIKSEHKETYVKCKAMELAILDYDKIGDLNPHDTSNFTANSGMAYDNIFDFIDEYEEKMRKSKEEKRSKTVKKSENLDEFMEDDE